MEKSVVSRRGAQCDNSSVEDRGICHAGVLHIESVNLICAKGWIFTNRGSAVFFPCYHFFCRSPSWSRVSVAVTFMPYALSSWCKFHKI